MTAPTALPELLGREDEEHGRWEVHVCAAERGDPRTSVADRIMFVPTGDDEVARVVRAHELMHARVSPGHDWPEWVARSTATERALRAAEEFRVNWLCSRAGFAVKRHLADGTEKAVGERLALRDDWAEAVYFAAACAVTASMTPYLRGIRRHRPAWAPVLRSIEARLVGDAKKIGDADLSATERGHESAGLAPFGFRFAEAWAVMLDGLAHTADQTDDDRLDVAGDAPITPGAVEKARSDLLGNAWPEVRVGRLPLTRHAPGGLGRHRRPADRGRAPRRINRLLTDPQRRIFDQHRRGNGGVVLLDGSGSMSLSNDDVRRILRAAPGATVAIYACTTGREPENLWVLADRGRMAETIPERPNGNGVDVPAIRWAIGQRQHASAPVVWITDGVAHRPDGRYRDRIGVECVDAALAGNVIVRPHVDSAVEALTELAARRRPKRWWPKHWRQSWQRTRGTKLRREMTRRGR